jgi:RimJ/RimL family protein N-acetyltransferase
MERRVNKMFLFKLKRTPNLRGKKTALRPLRKEDFPIIYSWFDDEEIMELAFGISRTESGFKNLLDSYKKEIEGNRQAFFGVENENNQLIGFSSHTFLEGERRARIGILIGRRDYWNKGYGRDAVMTLLHYLFEEKKVETVELDTAFFNIRAQKCFEACGFKRVEKSWSEPAGRFWYEQKRDAFLLRFGK